MTEKVCKNCKFWEDQNTKDEYPITAKYKGKKIGACRELSKSLFRMPKEGGFKTIKEWTAINFIPDNRGYPLYTSEDFSCAKHKQNKPID